MIEFAEWGYIGLFIASFLAATILPFSSEVVFSALVLAGMDQWGCVFAATLGNWLGGMSCYWLGMQGKIEWIEKYLKVSEDKLNRFQSWLNKRGAWTSFFAFLPGIGDIIAVALGYMRTNVYLVSFWMLLGKFIRYVLFIEGVNQVVSWI
ncbi:MAG: YqaA family protein [Bacteroidales bacterium]